MFGKDLSVEALERVYSVTDRLHFKIDCDISRHK